MRALWIAKTGLDAQQTRMSVVSNNLANVNTTGFKRDRPVFQDLLYQTVRQPGAQSSENTQLPSGLLIGTGVRTAATEKLTVGTGICLVPQHEPIALAKAIASLDYFSNGRFVFGIGGGWNVEEMEHHGVEPRTRRAQAREHVLAMRSLWEDDVARFEGDLLERAEEILLAFEEAGRAPHDLARPRTSRKEGDAL